MYYLKSRYYSPVLERFITRDDNDNIDYSNPQTLDPYSYAGNNPVSLVDPDGSMQTYSDPMAYDIANNLVTFSSVGAAIAGYEDAAEEFSETDTTDVKVNVSISGGGSVAIPIYSSSTSTAGNTTNIELANYDPEEVLGGAFIMSQLIPGADVAIDGIVVIGAAAYIIYQASNKKQAQKVIAGLNKVIQDHLAKMASSDPNDPDRKKWKKEIQAALE